MTTKQITIQDTIHNIHMDKPIDSMPVLRFNFTASFMTQLSSFAKIHQFDSRDDFKNAWKSWSEDNKTLIQDETIRLQQFGFTGNVHDKMFKSVRYYFRQKSTVPASQPPRKIYESMHKPILSSIDTQIKSIINDPSVSPADGFDSFCTEQMNLIIEAIRISYPTTQPISRDMIISYTNRLKKTYKNRFYNIKVSTIKTK